MLILPKLFRDIVVEEPVGHKVYIGGKYKVQVCRDGRVIREPFGDRFFSNLITNSGLDLMLNLNSFSPIQNSVSWARTGTGTTTPAVTDTQLVAQTQSTNTLTGSGSTFSNDTVNGAYTQTFSYEFPSVGATVTLNEFGVAQATSGSTGNNAIFSRALFPSGVLLNSGDNLRIIYSTTFSVPALITPITISQSAINGFNISGQLKVCGTFSGTFGTVVATQTTTATNAGQNFNLFFNGVAGNCTLQSTPTSFPPVNTSASDTVLGSSVTASVGGYTIGSFTRNITVTWPPSNPPSTVSNVNAMKLMAVSGGGIYLLLSSAQTKANTNTLTATFSCSISRV